MDKEHMLNEHHKKLEQIKELKDEIKAKQGDIESLEQQDKDEIRQYDVGDKLIQKFIELTKDMENSQYELRKIFRDKWAVITRGMGGSPVERLDAKTDEKYSYDCKITIGGAGIGLLRYGTNGDYRVDIKYVPMLLSKRKEIRKFIKKSYQKHFDNFFDDLEKLKPQIIKASKRDEYSSSYFDESITIKLDKPVKVMRWDRYNDDTLVEHSIDEVEVDKTGISYKFCGDTVSIDFSTSTPDEIAILALLSEEIEKGVNELRGKYELAYKDWQIIMGIMKDYSASAEVVNQL